jgi:hypothetical protein
LSASTRTSLTAEVDVKHCYNFFGIHRYYTEGTTPIPARDQLRMEFKYGGGGLAKGGDRLSPDDGPTDNDFSGEVNWVQIDLEKADRDHLSSPDERFKIAMARQ